MVDAIASVQPCATEHESSARARPALTVESIRVPAEGDSAAAAAQTPNADERIVFEQLQRIAAELVEMHDRDFLKKGDSSASMSAKYLVEIAEEVASKMASVDAMGDSQLCLARITALFEGAMVMDKAERPGAHDRHALEKRGFDLAESAGISYGFGQAGCEALALGIRTTRRPADERGVEQLKAGLELIASHLVTMRRLVMMIQGQDHPKAYEGDLLSSVEMLARTAGGIADEFSGNSILGDRDYWTFGPIYAEDYGRKRGAA